VRAPRGFTSAERRTSRSSRRLTNPGAPALHACIPRRRLVSPARFRRSRTCRCLPALSKPTRCSPTLSATPRRTTTVGLSTSAGQAASCNSSRPAIRPARCNAKLVGCALPPNPSKHRHPLVTQLAYCSAARRRTLMRSAATSRSDAQPGRLPQLLVRVWGDPSGGSNSRILKLGRPRDGSRAGMSAPLRPSVVTRPRTVSRNMSRTRQF